jgi:hypothetical protein
VTSLPAWVGVALNIGPYSCPNESPSSPPPVPQPPSNGYAAVVIGANGSPAVVYLARTAVCGFPATGPTIVWAK